MTPLLLALALAAPVPKDFKKAATDLAALQGEWECVERNNYGQPVAQSGMRYRIEGNTVHILGKGPAREVKLVLDEKAKTYTWDASWGSWHGRYSLDGDTFTRVSVKKGVALPDEIAAGKGVEFSVAKRANK